MTQGRRTTLHIDLGPWERQALLTVIRDPQRPRAFRTRCRLVLDRADGYSISAIARRQHYSRRHIYRWLTRFTKEGLAALRGRRGGRPQHPGGAP